MRKVTKYWTQKNGQKIRICDMTDSHLLNAAKLLQRNAQAERSNMPYPMFTGGMAQYYAEAEYYAMWEKGEAELAETVYPIYEYLYAEIERRNLTEQL